MDDVFLLIQKVFAVGCGVLLLLFVGWIVKRRFVDRKPIPPGVANASRANLMNLLNADQQAGLEHQMYMEEEERAEDEQGEKE
jgi:hypothetical protein